jgi:hypothetical protein
MEDKGCLRVGGRVFEFNSLVLLCGIRAAKLKHDESASPRGQRSSQATPHAHEEARLNHDQGFGHSQVREGERAVQRVGRRGKEGPTDSRRLGLITKKPQEQLL